MGVCRLLHFFSLQRFVLNHANKITEKIMTQVAATTCDLSHYYTGGANKQRVPSHLVLFVSVANVVRQPFNTSIHSVPRQGVTGPKKYHIIISPKRYIGERATIRMRCTKYSTPCPEFCRGPAPPCTHPVPSSRQYLSVITVLIVNIVHVMCERDSTCKEGVGTLLAKNTMGAAVFLISSWLSS